LRIRKPGGKPARQAVTDFRSEGKTNGERETSGAVLKAGKRSPLAIDYSGIVWREDSGEETPDETGSTFVVSGGKTKGETPGNITIIQQAKGKKNKSGGKPTKTNQAINTTKTEEERFAAWGAGNTEWGWGVGWLVGGSAGSVGVGCWIMVIYAPFET